MVRLAALVPAGPACVLAATALVGSGRRQPAQVYSDLDAYRNLLPPFARASLAVAASAAARKGWPYCTTDALALVEVLLGREATRRWAEASWNMANPRKLHRVLLLLGFAVGLRLHPKLCVLEAAMALHHVFCRCGVGHVVTAVCLWLCVTPQSVRLYPSWLSTSSAQLVERAARLQPEFSIAVVS